MQTWPPMPTMAYWWPSATFKQIEEILMAITILDAAGRPIELTKDLRGNEVSAELTLYLAGKLAWPDNWMASPPPQSVTN